MAATITKDSVPVITDRRTQDGRRIWYQLTVLQQPERARACGSGQKSANDRRPVDPPPVVELRIFEGHSPETRKDITFTYNASFFLFVTLEHARVIAHGRVQQAHNDNQPPVLTGSPVSGMAYLDRPSEAGYFLFPDLSVRHEGTYRLVFQLYEQPKEKADYDVIPYGEADESYDANEPPFCHRGDIKSNEFSVFSAKKFPGLAESTHLSRMVAEQGCRVRIRRDVRMRRREGKPGGGDYDKAEDDYSRTRRASQTPDMPRDPYFRPRSGSAASDHRPPYAPDPQRRTSGVDSYGAPPPFVASQPGPHSNLRFGDEAKPQFSPHYPPQNAQPPPVSPTAAYHNGHQSPYPPSQPQVASYHPSAPSQSYPGTPIKAEAPERRVSGPYPPSPAHPHTPSAESGMQPPVPSSYPPLPSPAPLAPYAASQETPNRLPSLATLMNSPAPPPYGNHSVPPRFQADPPIMASEPQDMRENRLKRTRDDTFPESTGSLANGRRQIDPHYREGRPYLPIDPDSGVAVYARSDGRLDHKQFPTYR